MNDGQQTTLWLGAFRYYRGRMTCAVSDFCGLLISAWGTLPDGTRNLIKRELEEAFKLDDEARNDGREYKPLGHDCDRAQWQRVRSLWVAK